MKLNLIGYAMNRLQVVRSVELDIRRTPVSGERTILGEGPVADLHVAQRHLIAEMLQSGWVKSPTKLKSQDRYELERDGRFFYLWTSISVDADGTTRLRVEPSPRSYETKQSY